MEGKRSVHGQATLRRRKRGPRNCGKIGQKSSSAGAAARALARQAAWSAWSSWRAAPWGGYALKSLRQLKSLKPVKSLRGLQSLLSLPRRLRRPSAMVLGGCLLLTGLGPAQARVSGSSAAKPAEVAAPALPAGPTGSAGSASLVLSWTPGPFAAQHAAGGSPGHYAFTVRASDGHGTVEQSLTLDVANTNLAPKIAPIPMQIVREGETMTFAVAAYDADGDTVALALVRDGTTPPGVSFDAQSGTVEWTPDLNTVDNSQGNTP